MAVNNAINSPLLGGIAGALPFASGGTGATSLAAGLLLSNGTVASSVGSLTNHGLMVAAGTAAPGALAVGTDGQVVIGSTGENPVFASLTSSDSSITFTQGAGTLSLQVAAGVGGLTWTDAAGSAQPAVAGNGYFSQGTGNVYTLPASPVDGNVVAFSSLTAATYQLVANTGQKIQVGSSVSTTAGNITSGAAAGTAVTLVYSATAVTWVAQNVVGSFTTA